MAVHPIAHHSRLILSPNTSRLVHLIPTRTHRQRGGAQGQCIADPDCIALHGNGYYCQNPNTANSSCQPCPTSTPAGYVLAQTMDYTPQLIGAGVVAAGIVGLAALAARGK